MSEILLRWQIGDQHHSQTVTSDSSTLIGRREDCHILLTEQTISRQHAEVFAQGGRFYLRNLSQTNPVTYNDRYRLAHRQEIPLTAGDFFRIGPIQIKVNRCEHQSDGLKVKCDNPNCPNPIVDFDPKGFCPYCGWSLATARTI